MFQMRTLAFSFSFDNREHTVCYLCLYYTRKNVNFLLFSPLKTIPQCVSLLETYKNQTLAELTHKSISTRLLFFKNKLFFFNDVKSHCVVRFLTRAQEYVVSIKRTLNRHTHTHTHKETRQNHKKTLFRCNMKPIRFCQVSFHAFFSQWRFFYSFKPVLAIFTSPLHPPCLYLLNQIKNGLLCASFFFALLTFFFLSNETNIT